MLDFAYLVFILMLLAYLMLSQRKELPFIVISHIVIQYFFATFSWIKGMDGQIASVLLLFLFSSSILLIWGRSLNYSRETKMIKVFVNVSQWGIFLLLVGLFLVKPYYVLHYSALGRSHHLGLIYDIIPPLFKICGNLLLFTTYLLFLMNWGNKWDLRKSLKSFLPLLLYFFLLFILYMAGAAVRNHPFA